MRKSAGQKERREPPENDGTARNAFPGAGVRLESAGAVLYPFDIAAVRSFLRPTSESLERKVLAAYAEATIGARARSPQVGRERSIRAFQLFRRYPPDNWDACSEAK